MRKDIMARLGIASIIICSIVITGINISLLGATDRVFVPVANFIIVALFWLWHAFNSPFVLLVGIILYLVLAVCFAKIVLNKSVEASIFVLYFLDALGAIYLLANRQGMVYTVSLVIDICILLLYLSYKTGNATGDGSPS